MNQPAGRPAPWPARDAGQPRLHAARQAPTIAALRPHVVLQPRGAERLHGALPRRLAKRQTLPAPAPRPHCPCKPGPHTGNSRLRRTSKRDCECEQTAALYRSRLRHLTRKAPRPTSPTLTADDLHPRAAQGRTSEPPAQPGQQPSHPARGRSVLAGHAKLPARRPRARRGQAIQAMQIRRQAARG